MRVIPCVAPFDAGNAKAYLAGKRKHGLYPTRGREDLDAQVFGIPPPPAPGAAPVAPVTVVVCGGIVMVGMASAGGGT